ncbi:hypothetical protein BDZ91DRAFT_761437 [Kalaharituber pfeilii]|nr:hypothetical protein BDZ91DRAFT_761437 [Kalaharituber pfeilii]
MPKLDHPLSELTSGYHHLPVWDIDSWVNSPECVRKAEVDKRNEKTKLWCLQNNHQVVSAISGESWPLEPEYIRGKYNELAKIERMNHQAAHPGYKFSPSKSQSSRKRKGQNVEQSEASDLDDLGDDLEYTENNEKRKKLPRQSRKQTKTSSYQEGHVNHQKYLDVTVNGEGGALRSSFAATNPGKTPPLCMRSTDMTGQYYQTTVCASRATPVPNGNAIIEDVTIQKTRGPARASNLTLDQSWVAPNLYNCDYSWDQTGLDNAAQENSKVDPLLLVQNYCTKR